jgi:hypothetical protein
MARRRWRRERTESRVVSPQRPRPDPELARIQLCALCARQARGFRYVHQPTADRYPRLSFCSMRCLDCGAAHAARSNGMIKKTDFERRAIREARQFFARALTELGLMDPFFHRTADDIDILIEACVDGFQESMKRQVEAQNALADEVPF